MCRSASVALSSCRHCPVSRVKFWSNGATENSFIICVKQNLGINDTYMAGWMPTKCTFADYVMLNNKSFTRSHYSKGTYKCDSNSPISAISVNIHQYENIVNFGFANNHCHGGTAQVTVFLLQLGQFPSSYTVCIVHAPMFITFLVERITTRIVAS